MRAWLAGMPLLLALGGCGLARVEPTVHVSLAGAQVPLELIESWLGANRSQRFVIERVQPVYLSQHGFENLLRKEADLACTDRPITTRELESFAGRRIQGRRVAFYGYAFYVNRQNPLDSIFAGHFPLLMQRKILDWKELGAGQGPIRLIGPRKSTRGGMILAQQARIFFADASWETRETDDEIVAAVAEDPAALGFAGLGHDQDVRYVGLRMERGSRPAFPSLEEIENEEYGLAKVIYAYYDEPASPAVAAVLEYLFGDAGRAAIERTNIWPISAQRSENVKPR